MQNLAENDWCQESSVLFQYLLHLKAKPDYLSFKAFAMTYPNEVKQELVCLKHCLKEDIQIPIYRWHVFQLLCLAGGCVSFCNGFNGVTSILLGFFPNILLGLLMVLGLVAACSSLAIFIAQDKPAITENLGMMPDIFLPEMDEYLFHIQRYLHHKQQLADLSLLNKLSFYYSLRDILKTKKVYNNALSETQNVILLSNMIISVGAILYFSDSFFVGQSTAYFLGQFLFFDPFLFSVCIAFLLGVAGLSYYWGRERPSLEQFLKREWFTDDQHTEERISQLNADIHALDFAQKCSQQFSL